MKSKGKEVAEKGSSGKRMREDTDKTGRKRKNRGVLQFFDDAAYEVDENESSEFSDFDDDFFEDEFGTEVKVKNEPGKAPQIPVLPKEEEMSEEELEKMLQERYKPGSSFVTYAEDGYDSKRSVERNAFIPSRDPTIWKVKCMVGRERHSAFCLMQKYLDLHSLGTKLQIISAFALEHVKGFIYIEADKHNDVNEACKGLCGIYSSRVAAVPKNEVSHLMSVRSKYNEVSQGTWARVKNGRYKGDLAQVVAVHHAKKKATVKLIPRIDLQVLGEKFGGGVKSNKAAIPAPRLLCSSELEEFRPLIQSRRDRDTGEFVEVLDGMMLKDGYLYKKISLDSLSCWGVVPLEEELLKFEFSKKDESEDLEWLSQLYGEPKKERTVKSDKGGKGGGKGEGSSSSSMANSFDVHDLVFFRRKDFGVIIGSEKDDSFKILKEGLEGPVVVTVDQLELKNASFDKRLTALDHRMKTILINDTVRVTEGPLEGKQGIVKKIYRGTIFLYNEHEQENGGYFCSKSQMCEKIKLSDDACNGKGDKSGPSVFEDFPSSPKSPLSPKKPWQPTENNRNFNQGDKDGMFSVGQSLRIRVGPLKGYLCRVLAIRRSDVTVKLDSQQKVLTVKCEHLSEVRGKSSAIPIGESGESVKPFDLLGTQDTSRDWIDGVGTSAEGEKWGAGGLSTERNAWPAFPSSSVSIQPEGDSVQNDTKKDVGDGAWGTKVTSNKTSSWGTAAADEKAVDNSEQVGGWNKATTSSGFGSGSSDNWGKAKISSGGDQTTGDTWGKAKLGIANPDDSSNENQDSGWKKSNEQLDKGKNVTGNLTSSWNNASAGKNPVDSWGKGKDGASGGSAWGKAAEKLTSNDGSGGSKTNWDGSIAAPDSQTGSWGNMGLSSAQPEVEASGWKKATGASGGSAWGKAAEKLTSNDGSGGSKTIGASDNQTGSWGNTGRSSAQPEIEASGWKKATNADGGQSENWGNMKKDGGQGKGGPAWGKATDTQDRDTGKGIGEDSWGKAAAEKWSGKDGSGGSKAVWNSSGAAATENQTGGTWGSAARPSAQTASWGTPKSSGGGQESGGWNNGGTGNKDDTVQQDSWGSPKVFDGGCGSGGRWGRGGGGRGGRDQFGRGRSFGGAQSSGWSKGEENYGTGDGNSGQSGGWGKAKAFDDGKQDDGCNKSNASGEDRGTSWNEGSGGIGDQKGGWNKRKAVDDNQNTPWGTKTNNVDGNRSWDTQKASQDRSSGWNQKSADNENDGVNKDQQGGWNSKKTSDGGSETGWGQSSKWNSGASDSAGTQNSGWGNKSNWSSANTFSGSGTSDFGGSENQTDSFGSRGRGGNWRGGRGGSDRGGRFGGRDNSDRGRFGGGDNSERGGFGGRDSERGGFRGRGNSDRGRSDWGGGFRGRGSSDRGGFGGRGRGRRDDFGDQKSYDWNKSSDNNTEGWKSTGGGSWNQSGADKGQGQSWSSGWNQSKGANGNGGTSDQAAVGWNKGSGSTSNSEGWKSTGGGSWNQSGADKGKGQSWSSGGNSSKEAEGNAGTTDQAAGGWSKGSGNAGWNQSGADKGKGQSWSSGGNSSKGAEGIAGTTDQAAGGWSKGSGNACWNQSGADKGKGQSWSSGGNSSKGAEGNAGTTDQAAGGWSKGSGNAGWNQPKEAKGATEDGGPADAWGKAAGSWGKGNGGGGKGGW